MTNTVDQVVEEARGRAQRYEQAKALLAREGLLDLFVPVPVDDLASMFERFLRLTKMGQATIEEWQAMPKELADLKHAIFRQSDFGALYAGQWLPANVRSVTRGRAQRIEGQ